MNYTTYKETQSQHKKTDASGNYSFQQVAQGDYYTKVLIPADYSFVSGQGYGSDGNSNYLNATGDNAITGYSVTLKQQANANINGLINTTTDAGVSGQNVSLYNVDGTLVKTVATAADGSFAFGSLPAGDYYVKAPIPANYTFASSNGFGSDGNSYYLHVGNNDTISNLRLTLAQESGQIRSTVFEDQNMNGTQEVGENGLSNAVVTLYSTDGTVVATARTNSYGSYAFENITPGNYYIKVTPPTGHSVLANAAFGKDGVSGYIKIDANQTRTDMNAAVIIPVTGIWLSGPYSIEVGEKGQVFAGVQPDNATDQRITYTIADPSIISINPLTGEFTGLKVGRTEVTVKAPSTEALTTVINVTDVAPVKATDITLDATNISATVGDTGKVNATVAPSDTANKTLTYTPADTSIISVDGNGNWTAKKAGTTTIAVKTTDGSNITKTITVTVKAGDVGVAGVFIAGPYTVNVGGAGQVNAWVTPENATHQELVYTVDDPSIVSIDPNTGKFTGLKAGSTTVYAKSPTSGITVKTTINVNPVKATDITLGATNIEAKVGDTGKVNATVAPSNTANKTLTYTPADSSIISVDANGNWTAKKEGTTTIAVKTTDGSNITKTITVKVGPAVPVSEVVISGPYNVKVGETGQVQAHVNPTNATHQELVYTVDDPSIVSINANTGAFTGLKEGSTTVNVTSPTSGITVKTTINVNPVKATDITLGATNIEAKVGDTGKVNATVAPSNTANKTLTYTPADSSIISVDANGNWTAKKEGTTTIAVKTTDGSNITKTITVKVGPEVAVSGVVISGPYNVKVGATGQVQAHVNPTNATHQELVYTVDDPSIVSINANTGAFTGLKEGSTTVNVTSPSTGVTVKTTININSYFSSIVEQGNFNGDKANGGPVQIYNAIEGLADKSSVTLTYNALDAEKESDQQTNGRRQFIFYVDGEPANFNTDYSFSISNTTVLNPNITNNNTDTKALGHIEVQVTKGTSTITVTRKSDNKVVKTLAVTVQ
ncbi:Ig-like domain-containing protein [Listeria riparia]|uniref:Ig domain-containing protein n=1 Tax=Listeria riparia FSL S10-1204 TaxID=1265816 RepID=W7D3S5_9LIST|nr:Ig-like domain-containing protein [Listeria riparia]EUJ43620.1 Ig domain-containing protein [Listeria riparia FSL S10-1204]